MSTSSSCVERLWIEIFYDEFEDDNNQILNYFGSLIIIRWHTFLCFLLRDGARYYVWVFYFLAIVLFYLLTFCIIFGMNVADISILV